MQVSTAKIVAIPLSELMYAYTQVSTNEHVLLRLPGVTDCPSLDTICAEIEGLRSRFGTSSPSLLAGQKRPLDNACHDDRQGSVTRHSVPLSPHLPAIPSPSISRQKRPRDEDSCDVNEHLQRIHRTSFLHSSPRTHPTSPLLFPSPYLVMPSVSASPLLPISTWSPSLNALCAPSLTRSNSLGSPPPSSSSVLSHLSSTSSDIQAMHSDALCYGRA